MTRNTGAGNIYVDTTEPTDKASGTIWIDISTASSPKIFVATGSAYVQQTGGALGAAATALSVNSGVTGLEYAAVGPIKHLGTGTVSSGTSVSVSGLSDYDIYFCFLEWVTANTAAAIRFNDISTNSYTWALLEDTTKSTSTNTYWLVSDSHTKLCIYFKIFKRSDGKLMIGNGASDASLATINSFSGVHASTAAITKISALSNGGETITAGRLVVWGANYT